MQNDRNDVISRQAAIDALMVRDKELRNINWYDKPYAEGECRGIDEALAIVSNLPSVQPLVIHCTDCEDWLERQSILGFTISELPSAQPKRTEKRTETHACDLIDRRALMKELSDFVRASNNSDFARTPIWNDAVSLVGSMPSVQSEIIRCKGCKHKHLENAVWTCPFGLPGGPDFYCGYGAERRQDVKST